MKKSSWFELATNPFALVRTFIDTIRVETFSEESWTWGLDLAWEAVQRSGLRVYIVHGDSKVPVSCREDLDVVLGLVNIDEPQRAHAHVHGMSAEYYADFTSATGTCPGEAVIRVESLKSPWTFLHEVCHCVGEPRLIDYEDVDQACGETASGFVISTADDLAFAGAMHVGANTVRATEEIRASSTAVKLVMGSAAPARLKRELVADLGSELVAYYI